jgi:cell shape-determining protein MreC
MSEVFGDEVAQQLETLETLDQAKAEIEPLDQQLETLDQAKAEIEPLEEEKPETPNEPSLPAE